MRKKIESNVKKERGDIFSSIFPFFLPGKHLFKSTSTNLLLFFSAKGLAMIVIKVPLIIFNLDNAKTTFLPKSSFP